MRAVIYPSLMECPRVDETTPDPGEPRYHDQNIPHRNFATKLKQAAFLAVIPALFFTNTTGQADFPEQNIAEKVSVQYPAKVFDIKRQQHTYPSMVQMDESHLGDPKLVTDPEKQASTSYHPDFVFDKKRTQYTYPSMMPIDTAQMTQGEDNGVPYLSKWLGYHPDYIFRSKSRKYYHLWPAQETIVKQTGSSSSSACSSYHAPTTLNTSVDVGAASDFTQMYTSDDVRSSFNALNDQATLGNFGDFGIPAGSTIDGIQVRVEGLLVGAGINHIVGFALRDGAIYWAGDNSDFNPTSTGADETQDLGGATNQWGNVGNWSIADFADGTFRVRLTCDSLSATSVDIDYFEVSVCYTTVTPSWEHPPETITMDKWKQQQDDIVYDKKRVQWAYPYWFSDMSHLGDAPTEQDLKWPPSYPDKVFGKKRIQYTYPWTFPSPDTFFPEAVTIDRFGPQQPDYIFDKRRRQDLYPSFFVDDYQLTQPERATPDKWLGYYPDKVFDQKRQQYTYPSLFYRQDALDLYEQGFLPALYQTNTPLFDKKRQQHTYPSFMVIDQHHMLDSEFLAVNWLPSYPDFIFDKRRTQYTYPDFSVIDLSHIGDAETITVDKWNRLTPDIVFDKNRRQYVYPTLFFHTEPIPYDETQVFNHWLTNYPHKIFDKKRTQYTYPTFFVDLKHFADVEVTTPDKWIPQKPDIIFDKVRRQDLFPYIFIDFSKIADLDPRNVAMWMPMRPDILFDKIRRQDIFPYLFYYDGLIHDFCPPATGWTPESVAGSGWTKETVQTAGWTKASTNQTGWGKANPNTTDWDITLEPTTDWDPTC